MVEGIQGEGGVTPASPDYLLGLRQLCDEKKLLLLMDSVQCGHFRTGRFQSFQRILEGVPGGEAFLPDGISMAKSLGGGFPIGAFWVRAPYADLLGAGSHGTTYGGSPLACAVALKILEVIQREKLADNARQVGGFLKTGLQQLAQKYPERHPDRARPGPDAGHRAGAQYSQPARRQQQDAGGPFREPAACRRAAGDPRRRANHAFPAAAQPAARRGGGRAEANRIGGGHAGGLD